jgi:hypothetical protein
LLPVLISVVFVGIQVSAESTAATGLDKKQKIVSLYHVDVSSTASSPDGSSWAKAYNNLQDAADQAFSDGGGEIWVAAGTYTSTNDQVLIMKEMVALYGGFAGDETFRDQREPHMNKTLIDGEGVRRCILGSDNSSLDGFTIARGFNDAVGGGGMLNLNASPSVSNCTFEDNSTNGSGGALCNESGSEPELRNCLFYNNEALYGGAITNKDGSIVSIRSGRFVSNRAEYGGAVYNEDNSTVALVQVQFIKNTGDRTGGAIYNNDGAVTIDECVFFDNFSETGGAIANWTFNGVISNCLFYKNRAEAGGALYSENSAFTITNSLFRENQALEGGAIVNGDGSHPLLVNCTIANNRADEVGGILNWESSPRIVNSILWGNSDEQINLPDWYSHPEVSYSCIQGGHAGTDNIDENPRFLNAPHSFQLMPDSPCIDAGTSILAPVRDLVGRPRPVATGTDMGAYEGAVPVSERFTLTLETTPEGLGRTLPPAGTYLHAKGDMLVLQAVPNGAALKQWSGDFPTKDPILIAPLLGHLIVRAEFESNILYVDAASTSGSPDGQSWATAFQDIQSAVDAASRRGGGELWVAEGTYTSTDDQVVLMQESVALYGGFSGHETLRDERDWNAHPTVIDGEGLRRCLLGADNAVLDGFVITGGNAIFGGGMLNYHVSPTVANSHFTENASTSGGAMTNYASEVTVYNCIFTENNALSIGGAVYDSHARNSYINCSFVENSALVGGAVVNESTSSRIVNSIIWGNLPIQIDSDIEVSYSCIQNGFEGIGNIEEDPMFLQAPQNLRLHMESPCIDAGTLAGAPPFDYLKEPRPQGAKVDMGAYEKVLVPLEDQYTLTIEVTPEGLGSSYPSPGTYHCAPGDVVGIRAVSQGAGFLYWRGDALSSNKEITVVMDGHKTVTAHFLHMVHFVDADSTTPTPDGLSWATAFRDIQSGVDAAETKGGGEVWVAEGTYIRRASDKVVEMKEGVMLYGGFRGNESQRKERDWEVHPAVIDGENQRLVISGANHALLDGFVITRGFAKKGGGMLNSLTSPTVTNCSFIENEAYDNTNGGAMYNLAASPVVSHCKFIRNKSDLYGGAVYNYLLSPTFTDCSFLDNMAYVGGAMTTIDTTHLISGCTFSGNSAESGAGALYAANGNGIVSHCTFTGNASERQGGAVITTHATTLITNCVFSQNRCLNDGGAMLTYGDYPVSIINTVFIKNNGGTDGKGGAIANLENSSPKIINCTITENTAHSGGGIYNSNASSPQILNSILWANTPEEVVNHDAASVPVVTYSCVEGGYGGTGNIDSDPLFVLVPGDLKLAEGSPCIDTGDSAGAPEKDLLDRSRPRGAGFDMGAYEFIPPGEEEFPEGEEEPPEGEVVVPPIEGEPPVVIEGEPPVVVEGEQVAPDEGEGETLVPDEGEGEDDTKPDDGKPKGCNCGKSKGLMEEGFSLEQLKKNLSDWLLTGVSVMILLTFAAHRRS